MRGLSSLERIIIDCIGKESLNYVQIQNQTGLQENVCFNILQTLIVRGLLITDGLNYKLNQNLSALILEEINCLSSRQAESLELIEALIDQKDERVFKFQKIALDDRDEKIFRAMLLNLETFLVDCHKKAQTQVPLKSRKVIFWGMSEVNALMHQMTKGIDL
jgi:hypothetical protein